MAAATAASLAAATAPYNNNKILCEGFCYKKPQSNAFLWKKRYFVLYETDPLCLLYFENAEKASMGMLRGKIYFSSLHLWDGKPNGFQFYTPFDKLYRIYVDSETDRKMWMTNMQAQLDACPDTKYSTGIEIKPSTQPNSTELCDLKAEVATLRSELTGYRQSEQNKYKDDFMNSIRDRRGTTLEDGSFIDIEPNEMETMRQIFNLFDPDGNGFISLDELQSLHSKLGEPITKEDAEEALKFINPVGNKVTFASFLKWWHEDHKSSDKDEEMKRYKAKFKFLKARITNPIIGMIDTSSIGPFPSFEFRQNFYYTDNGTRTQISPWHDVPLYNSDGSVNFVCEIPKWTRKKMEIATGEPFNPIKQDTKNGKLREYTWGDMMFNYGALPQTWEDPDHITEGTNCKGDNDPIDVVEIGSKQWPIGAIVQVKVLGVLALIDSGETDWKLICINIEDHFASLINDVADVDAHIPGCINAIRDWLRDYKLPKVNEYGYDGKCMSKEFADAVVSETHSFWKELIADRGGMATV